MGPWAIFLGNRGGLVKYLFLLERYLGSGFFRMPGCVVTRHPGWPGWPRSNLYGLKMECPHPCLVRPCFRCAVWQNCEKTHTHTLKLKFLLYHRWNKIPHWKVSPCSFLISEILSNSVSLKMYSRWLQQMVVEYSIHNYDHQMSNEKNTGYLL